MRTGLWLMTIFFALVGFVYPLAWAGALVTAALALIGSGIMGIRSVAGRISTNQSQTHIACSLCKTANVRGSSICANCGAQLYFS